MGTTRPQTSKAAFGGATVTNRATFKPTTAAASKTATMKVPTVTSIYARRATFNENRGGR